MKVALMIPGHPQWVEFCNKLQEMQWCEHEFGYAIECLNLFAVDTDRTLAWFQEHGGYCDCEIIFNIICPAFDDEGNFIGKMHQWEVEV